MKKAGIYFSIVTFAFSAAAQSTPGGDFSIALPEHKGQLSWSAPGFKIIQSSAKPGGREIGIRGRDDSGRHTFPGFLFLFPEQAPLTTPKCRDGVLDPEKRTNKTLKVLSTTDTVKGGLPVSTVTYTSQGRTGTEYRVRAFVATGGACGDLEIYSDSPISGDDPDLKKIIASYRLDQNYVPQFNDVFFYAQVLYQAQMYKDAAPIFEIALVKLKGNPEIAAKLLKDQKTARRVVTDQAGMAYGMAGDIAHSRSLFEKATAEDPDYPLYYYNLACADAEEKNLTAARNHLQQAFARKANVIPGEAMPDPTEDDSFLPYQDNKEFWTFLESLQSKH